MSQLISSLQHWWRQIFSKPAPQFWEINKVETVIEPKSTPHVRRDESAMKLEERSRRDHQNAFRAAEAAAAEAKIPVKFQPATDFVHGNSGSQEGIYRDLQERRTNLRTIACDPFHAMAEAAVKTGTESRTLWYGNKHSTCNLVLKDSAGEITIVAWTHPGFQLALTAELNEESKVRNSAYALRSIRPLARARFKSVLPNISGLYEPGGQVNYASSGKPSAGLKAIKLEMTREQVEAFVARMHGTLFITGAPGTGKTTIALQRIRFLLDQQREWGEKNSSIEYAPGLTKVFLANPNLLLFSKHLLNTELSIPENITSYVPKFIHEYVERCWTQKLNRRIRKAALSETERRAREAFFNLCKVKDLKEVWAIYEKQVRDRLQQSSEAEWMSVGNHQTVHSRLASSLSVRRFGHTENPLHSSIRMDSLFDSVSGDYENCRKRHSENDRRKFDAAFSQWLFWVYDPISTLRDYFSSKQYEGKLRIKNGTGEILPAAEVIQSILGDWERNSYGPEEQSWIAWLLRLVLPEESEPTKRFREIASALPQPDSQKGNRWTHIVIDEAQDLSVQEASLLASLVHSKGAMTISADFKQVVSPVHGMVDAEALKFAASIKAEGTLIQYPFKKNLRQTKEIGRFLQNFYLKTFRSVAPFDPGDRSGPKPHLYTGKATLLPHLIKQMLRALSHSKDIKTVALLQIDEDLTALNRLRTRLEKEGIPLAAPGVVAGKNQELILTSVEKAKGLEFDAGLVLGLDGIEKSSLNFVKNRSYVALSRPMQRLFIFCEEFPPLLKQMERDLFDHSNL